MERSKIIDTERHSIIEGNSLTWKDLVCANHEVHAEEFPIEREYDLDEKDGIIFRVDRFITAAAEKYGCDEDTVTTWTMEGDAFDSEAKLPEGFYQSGALAFGIEDCGAYINGMPAEDVLEAEGIR